MIHTLGALRKNSDLLLVTMDVFIKEPSLDWEVSLLKSDPFVCLSVHTTQNLCLAWGHNFTEGRGQIMAWIYLKIVWILIWIGNPELFYDILVKSASITQKLSIGSG